MRAAEACTGSCLFVSDLHGREARYEALFRLLREEAPAALFLGGDLLPPFAGLAGGGARDFLRDVVGPGLAAVRADLGDAYPRVFAILGNDDPASEEPEVHAIAARGLWEYVHGRRADFGRHPVYGYACIPPSPFPLKDWERYDVSRFVDPGCTPPEEGWRTRAADTAGPGRPTIGGELKDLVGGDDLRDAILLVHVPPHGSLLDRAALDGRTVDHAPLDVHIGSLAVRRLIEERQPLVSLHGHVHESARLTGSWRDRIGRTVCLSAAHDGPELAVVRFDPASPEAASRELI
jgi:Icc-related predicted phosphoesterase